MRLIRISVIVLLAAFVVFGQTNKGGISGTVTDANGAAVPGAKVIVTNLGTNQNTTITTSSSGGYSINSLEPVTYSVTVEAPNFKKSTVPDIKVDTASIATVNVALEAGNIGEQVTVEADTQTVSAESGTISQTISERQLRDLPLNNRSVLDLAVTMPNVSGDAGSEDIDANSTQPVPGFNLSVNGGRPGSTSILADGVNNTGVGIARAVVSFTPETVQEFTVQSSAYSAEYGTTGGGVINITTKSGTNRLNGTALWYTRNPATNARPWRQGSAPRPPNNLRSNQLSFTVGGPIYLPALGEGGPYFYDGHNKSFFFFAYEPRYRTDFVSSTGLLPTAAERTGNFRDLVRTNSGFLPSAIATQYNQASTGDANIYQQFTVSGGKLVPIVLTNTTTFQYCQFGAVNTSFNAAGQPQCTSAQAAAQNAATNPALNIIPSAYMDPISNKLLTYLDPTSGYFLDNGLVRNYFLTRSVKQNETRYTLRLDHNFTSKFKANFRYTKTPAVGIKGAGGDINGNTGVYSDAKQYLVTFNNIISSSIVNDLRVNYTKGNFSEDFSPEFSIKSGRNFSSELGLTSLTTGGMPLIFLTQDNGYVGADLGAGGSTNNFNVEKRKNISDTLYWTHGNTSWRFGTDLSDARLQVVPFFAASGGRWQFRTVNTSNNRGTGLTNGGNDLASFLLGVPNAQDFRPSLFTYNYKWLSGAFFAQNDWKIKPNLTLNIGLRYALQLPRTEANNLQGVFRPDLAQTVTLTTAPIVTGGANGAKPTQRGNIAIASGIAIGAAIPDFVPTTAQIVPFAFAGRGGRSRHITPIDKNDFEPRFGFAYSPKMKIFGMDLEKKSFVIRGGYGISHAPINGNNRAANPDFGGFTTASTLATGSSGGSDNNSPIRFTGNNALQGSTVPLDTLLGTTPDGLVFSSALGIPGVAVNATDKGVGSVPYSQNFNLAVQFELTRNTTVEIAYVGNKGIHLYTPQVNISRRDPALTTYLESNGINATGTITDPLGRKTLLGAAIAVPIGSLYSSYLGVDLLNRYFDPSSSSIRHAGYIDVRRRIRNGLNFTANYTWARSIDDSSDASPDVRVLTTGSVRGQVSLGGSRRGDRALSSFDVEHNFSSTFTYDSPFGKGRTFFKNAPWYITQPLGGWTMSGIYRIVGGSPYQPFITDPNHLGSANLNRVVRPDIVSGVPLINPLWNKSCRVGNACEPYLNPAAFLRPVKGQLGNAPRTLTIRSPARNYFDFSIQKDFALPFIGGEGKRKFQFRVDLLNAFNKPVFYWSNLGNTPFGMGTFPTEITGESVGGVAQPITVAEYNTWANFNGQPPAVAGGTGPGNVIYDQIRTTVNAVRLPPRAGSTSGALPDNFFHIQLPQGFATTDFRSFDIRTLDGFRLYRVRQTYDTNFGTLTTGGLIVGVPSPASNSRYVQFGLKLFF